MPSSPVRRPPRIPGVTGNSSETGNTSETGQPMQADVWAGPGTSATFVPGPGG
jgi:hypothetical protein